MEHVIEPDVFTATVAPLLQGAKRSGASARALSNAFLGAMTHLYGDADLKETSAAVGFIRLLNAEGGVVAAKNAAKLYGGPVAYSEEAVRKAARQGQVIAFRDGNGNLHFPVWQFGHRGGLLPGLKDILAILTRRSASDDLAVVTFLLNPTARLEGQSPLEALRQDDEALRAQVRQLAHEATE